MSASDAPARKQPFLYETVRSDIIAMIRSRRLAAHDAIPSEGAIAESYGVSRMTGKLALKSLEEAGVIYRVKRRGSFLADGFEERIEAMGASGIGAQEESGTPITIALVVPTVDFYTGDIVRCINAEAAERSIRVLLRISDESPEAEDKIIAELSRLTFVQGIILFPTEREDFGAELLRLKLRRYPVILIDRTYGNLSFDSVVHAHYDGAHSITSYLVEKGHRNIGFATVMLRTSRSREERYQGYLHALIEHGVAVKKEYIQTVESGVHGEHGLHVLDSPAFSALRDYLTRNPEITAVFCSEDYLAIELYYAATSLGLRVPDDISIAGFTDNRVLRFVPARLSTVRQPVRELGRAAVELMVYRLDHPDDDYRQVKISTEIVDRESISDMGKKISDSSL